VYHLQTVRILSLSMIVTATFIDSVWAGPPFITDDPEPVEYRHWEINYALTESWRNGEISANIPALDINYGASPDLQLHVQPRYSYEKTVNGSRFGIDDTELGAKYRFWTSQHDTSSTSAAIYPMVQLPTGDTRLGPSRGQKQSFLPLWVQHDNETWTVYGGAGYRINPGTGNKNSFFTGAAALYRLSQKLQLGGELFHETPTAIGDEGTAGFNLGGAYSLTSDCNFLFSAGRARDSTNERSIYFALQVIY
jgi:hypothetical protein